MGGRGNILLQALLVLVILGSVNLLATRFFSRVDLTENNVYTMSSSTRSVLENLDDVVNVRVYFSRGLPSYMATLDREIKDLLDEYRARGGDNLVVEFLDPEEDPATERAVQGMGIPKLQLNIIQKDKAEVVGAYLGIAVQYGDRQEVIPVVQSTSNLEYDLTAAVLKLTGDEKTIGFAGPAEVGLFQNMTGLRQMLERQFRLIPIDLESGPVDESVTTLMLVDHDGLSDAALYGIDQFLMRGGRLFVFAPAGNVPEGTLNAQDRILRTGELLRTYGVDVQSALVVDAQSAMASFSQGYFSFTVAYPWWPQIPPSGLSEESPITSTMDAITLPWTSPLELTAPEGGPVTGTVLASSSIRSFAGTAPYDLDPQQRMSLPTEGVEPRAVAASLHGRFPSRWADGSPVPGDSLGAATPLLTSPETQVVVVGSWRFAEDSFLQQFPSNAVFVANALDWMTLGNALIEIRSRTGTARPLRQVDDGQRRNLKIAGILLVPVLVVLAGLVRQRLRKLSRARQARFYGDGGMSRSSLALLGLAITLGVLVVLFVNPFEDGVRRDNPSVETLFAFAPGEVDRVQIRRPGGEVVELARSGDAWVVASRDDFPADTTVVGSMVRAVAQARAGSVVSRNPDRQPDLQVDDTGVGVALHAGERTVADFLLGKPGPDFTTSYLRPRDRADVFLVRGLNTNLFDRPRGYRDPSLLRFAWEDVASLTWAAADTGWAVAKGDTAWVVTSPDGTEGPAQTEQVDMLFRVASNLNADGFFEGDPDTLVAGLDAPDYTLTVRFTDGGDRWVRFGNTNQNGQRYVSRDGRDAVYLMGDWNLTRLRLRASSLVR